LREELAQPAASVSTVPSKNSLTFGDPDAVEQRAKLRSISSEAKKTRAHRMKELKSGIKELERLQAERDEREKEVKDQFDREIIHIHEAAADLLRICSDPIEAARYFTVSEVSEIAENEFNLNLPRYVDTFDPEEEMPLDRGIEELDAARQAARISFEYLDELLKTAVKSSQ